MSEHEQYMQRALSLAIKAEGQTSPNPMVGAVIVKEGRIIAEGYHHQAGQPHAEVEAIRAAKEPLAGACMYVSLEPCCVQGRTPPCTKALIEAGIKRVYYAVPDDNPRVAGGGHRQLEAAGLQVIRGPLEAEARFLNRHFFTYITHKRCYVTAKYAMSLDGKIATHSGQSQWITGSAARQLAHGLRHVSDAIMVGAGTALADNPRLTTRSGATAPRHPLRILVDSKGRVPANALLYNQQQGSALLATTQACPEDHRLFLQDQGITCLVFEANANGRVPLPQLLSELAQRGIVRLMVEGGSQLLGNFLQHQLIDEVWAFLGSKLIGGHQAPGPIGDPGFSSMLQLPDFKIYNCQQVAEDVLVKATRA